VRSKSFASPAPLARVPCFPFVHLRILRFTHAYNRLNYIVIRVDFSFFSIIAQLFMSFPFFFSTFHLLFHPDQILPVQFPPHRSRGPVDPLSSIFRSPLPLMTSPPLTGDFDFPLYSKLLFPRKKTFFYLPDPFDLTVLSY